MFCCFFYTKIDNLTLSLAITANDQNLMYAKLSVPVSPLFLLEVDFGITYHGRQPKVSVKITLINRSVLAVGQHFAVLTSQRYLPVKVIQADNYYLPAS